MVPAVGVLPAEVGRPEDCVGEEADCVGERAGGGECAVAGLVNVRMGERERGEGDGERG